MESYYTTRLITTGSDRPRVPRTLLLLLFVLAVIPTPTTLREAVPDPIAKHVLF